MKRFTIDGETWISSECGHFVALIEGGVQSGWYALDMFNARFKAAASTTK